MKKPIPKLAFLKICSIIGIISFLFIVDVNSQCPDLTLNVITDSLVCDNENDTVIIENSEASVVYQVYNNDRPISCIQRGTGNNIAIPVHSSRLDTGLHTLRVKAFADPVDQDKAPIFETSVPPVIDGIPDEEEWMLIRDHPNYSWGDPPDVPEFFSQWGVMYDDTCLYLAVYVQDNTLPLASESDFTKLHKNDAVEFILQGFDAEGADDRKILLDCHNQVNMTDVPYDAFYYDVIFIHAAHIDSSKNAWSGEIRIAWSDLGYTSPPDSMKFDSNLDFADTSGSMGQYNWTSNGSFKEIIFAGMALSVPNDTCPHNVKDSVPVQILPHPHLIVNDPDEAASVDITDPSITSGSEGLSGNQLTYWEDSLCTSQLSDPEFITTSGTYYIKLSNPGCFDVGPVNVTVLTTGICNDSMLKQNNTLHPNPLSYGEVIYHPANFQVGESFIISVYNELGQQIISKQIIISSQTMPVRLFNHQDVSQGIYIVKVEGQTRQEQYKLIVE